MKSLVLFLTLLVVVSARVSFDGYQVWRLTVGLIPQQKIENIIQEFNLDVWASTTKWVDIMVSSQQQLAVRRRLVRIGISSEIFIDNVQNFVDRDFKSMDSRVTSSDSDFDLSVYHKFEEIEDYLKDLSTTSEVASLISLGKTIQDRDIWQLTVSSGENRQPVWIDCGIHAREWISHASCVWFINNLVTNYGTDDKVTELVDAYDFQIVPVLNPDGYAHTLVDRTYRKNRNWVDGCYCMGVDINRNFDAHFGGAGTSVDCCDNMYMGPFAASELETQAQQKALKKIASSAKALFTLHSYGQLWMHPFAYTEDMPPEVDQMEAVSKAACEAIFNVHGTTYEYGSIGDALYLASGNTVDYSYSAGIIHSYALELRDNGTYGFMLPEDQIIPTATETWAGITAAIGAIP